MITTFFLQVSNCNTFAQTNEVAVIATSLVCNNLILNCFFWVYIDWPFKLKYIFIYGSTIDCMFSFFCIIYFYSFIFHKVPPSSPIFVDFKETELYLPGIARGTLEALVILIQLIQWFIVRVCSYTLAWTLWF